MLVERDSLPKIFDLCAIDADIIVYRCAFSAQKTLYDIYDSEGNIQGSFRSKKEALEGLEDLLEEFEFFLKDIPELTIEPRVNIEPVESAYRAVDDLIAYIKERVTAQKYKLYLTDSESNYRNFLSVTKVYKGNREDVPKPTHYLAVKEYLQKAYGAYVVVGQEADDAVSVLGCVKSKKTCVATIDKDLQGSPIIIYDFSKDVWHSIDELEADRFFFKQCLTGDATDNIAGVSELTPEFRSKYSIRNYKGVGEKAAQKILEGCKTTQEMYQRVREAYTSQYGEKKGLTRLNEMGKLLWMQRKKGVIFDVSWFETAVESC